MSPTKNPLTFDDLYPGASAIFDGGIATELYERGFYINRPFEELNLTHPRDVAGVHQAYLEAGAMAVTTNSFSLTTPQLEKFDNQGRQGELLQAAIRIAHGAVKSTKSGAKVGLSLGPMGVLIEPLGKVAKSEVVDEYEKLSRLAQAGGQDCVFDFYILETFGNIDELECAIDGIRRADPVRPILASVTVVSAEAAFIAAFAKRIGERADVQALGMNCSEGPHDLLQSLKVLRPLTAKKIVIQPNAGIPRNINGRYFYMTSPDYMAKFAKRFAEAGAWGVGGCCGTGPDHIRAITQAMKMVEVKRSHYRVDTTHQPHLEFIEGVKREHTDVDRRTLDKRRRSRIGEKLAAGKKVITIELASPRGTNLTKFLTALEKCRKAGVEFVNVPDGARASTRVSSLHLAAYINTKPEIGVTVLPHFTTRDRNLIALQSDLLGASVNNVHDILLITGDPPKLGNTRDATAVYDIDSIGLTYLVDRLNQGLTPSGDDIGSETHYGIGVASNPTALNLELELKRWQYKVESGADFAVTQPIYEAETFLRWKKAIGAQYRPHIVGIWPFVSYKNAEFMAHEVPGVFVPSWALDEMQKVQDDPEASVRTGVQIAARIMNELWNHCEGFAISAPLGKVDVALETLKHLKEKI
ncbi:MAG: bifunctional homocysteine S-methyltransferase/methylenetetrahydrofolate reductase [Bdellovibrionales bacterium]|nr:bifunctional homocysteine S-methyltransferase/methylenetetrahydrofolate reductase [Bdellovibrionales bacterium]